jgi:hypothetical protein
MTQLSLERKIVKYESKLGDLRDKIKNIFTRKGKAVPAEEEKKVEFYQNKLAYYRKMGNMKGGATLNQEQQNNLTTLVNIGSVPSEEDAIAINALGNKTGDNFTDEEIQTLERLSDTYVRQTDDAGNIIINVPEGAEIPEDAETIIIEEPEDIAEQPAMIPDASSTALVATSEATLPNWDQDKQSDFINLLNTYGESLITLIGNLKDLTQPQQEVVQGIADRIRELGEKLKYKDEIIEKYIQVFSDTQSNLSDWRLSAEGQKLDSKPADAVITNLDANSNNIIEYYSLMTGIYDYLAKVRAARSQVELDRDVMNAIFTIMRDNKVPSSLKNTLINLANRTQEAPYPVNDNIRVAIYNQIQNPKPY